MSLSPSSINSAYPLAAIVSRSGKSLGVVEGSALADCLAACDTGFDGIVEDGVPFVPDEKPEVIVMENAGDDHTVQSAQLTANAARAVAYTMDIARNHVNPKIKQVVDATEAYIDAKRSSRLTPFVIKPTFLADIYNNADLQDLVAKHAGTPHRDVPAEVITAQWDDAKGLGHLHTGIDSLDNEISSHFSGREAEVQDRWQRYFSNVPGKYRSGDFRHDLNTADDALVLFLGAHHLANSDEVPEGLNTSLAGYNAYVNSIKDQMGSQLARRVKNHRADIESNQLVINAPRPSRPGEVVSGTIEVHGDVYNKWLEAGGTPEALMGACLTGDALTYGVCLDNAADNTASWERHMSGLNAQAVFELRSSTITGLRNAIIDVAKGVYAARGDGAYFNVTPLNNALAALSPGDLDNLYTVARNLVCDLFYAHTDAKAFLEAYDDAASKNPNLDAGEVALIVTIDYVNHWVASMVTLSGETIQSNN